MALILPIAANSRPFSDLSTIKASVFFSVAVAQFSSVPASAFLPLKYNQLTGKGLFWSDTVHWEKEVVGIVMLLISPVREAKVGLPTGCQSFAPAFFQTWAF